MPSHLTTTDSPEARSSTLPDPPQSRLSSRSVTTRLIRPSPPHLAGSRMELSPPEVLHAICALLPHEDVANIRRVSKTLADIGSHYLISKIRFNQSLRSVQRLLKLSQNTSMARSVTALEWEAAHLSPAVSITDLRQMMHMQQNCEPKPAPPPEAASTREKRLYKRNLAKWSAKPEAVTDEMVKSQFVRYKRQLLAEDQGENRLLFEGRGLMRALRKFPNLRHITYDAAPRCKHLLSELFVDRFKNWHVPPPLDPDTGDSVYQVRWLLAAIAQCKSQLESLNIRHMAPSFFECHTLSPATSTTIPGAFQSLKTINVLFRLSLDHEHFDDAGCFGILGRGGLKDMLACAPLLVNLTIGFEGTHNEPDGATDLKNVLGEHVWPKLQSVDLTLLSTTEDQLLATLQRQPSLKSIEFTNITLNTGSWVTAARRLQQDLEIDEAFFSGVLISNDTANDEFWDMEAIDLEDENLMMLEEDGFDFSDAETETLAMALSYFITYGDEDDEDPFWSHEWYSPMLDR